MKREDRPAAPSATWRDVAAAWTVCAAFAAGMLLLQTVF